MSKGNGSSIESIFRNYRPIHPDVVKAALGNIFGKDLGGLAVADFEGPIKQASQVAADRFGYKAEVMNQLLTIHVAGLLAMREFGTDGEDQHGLSEYGRVQWLHYATSLKVKKDDQRAIWDFMFGQAQAILTGSDNLGASSRGDDLDADSDAGLDDFDQVLAEMLGVSGPIPRQ